MDRIVLTYGYVPIDHKVEEIYCGDSETSETLELNFEIIEDYFLGIDNDFKLEIQGHDLWNHESIFYRKLSKTISDYFGFDFSEQFLFGGYSLLLDEPTEFSGKYEFVESEEGIVNNFNCSLNGKVFIRFYFEEDGDIFDEKVISTLETFVCKQ